MPRLISGFLPVPAPWSLALSKRARMGSQSLTRGGEPSLAGHALRKKSASQSLSGQNACAFFRPN